MAISWVRGVVNKTDVTIMKSRWMGSTLGDIVILLGCSPCKTLVFCGSAASIRDEIEVGDFVIPSRAWIGEGFSRYYGCDSQNVSNECYDFSEPASKSKSLFCSVLANKLHVLFHEGVEPMKVEGELFDPNTCEAIGREETDECEDGRIIEELRKGYTMRGKVIRPALVKVAVSTKKQGSEKEEKNWMHSGQGL